MVLSGVLPVKGRQKYGWQGSWKTDRVRNVTMTHRLAAKCSWRPAHRARCSRQPREPDRLAAHEAHGDHCPTGAQWHHAWRARTSLLVLVCVSPSHARNLRVAVDFETFRPELNAALSLFDAFDKKFENRNSMRFSNT